jgi:LysM repeat protein
MNSLRQVGLGILAALVSVAILLGSLSLALQESAPRLAAQSPSITWTPLAPFPTLSPSPFASSTLVAPLPGSLVPGSPVATLLGTPMVTGSSTVTSTPSPTSSPMPAGTLTATLTPPPPADCPPPSDWMPITIQEGDTLESIAAAFRTTVKVLIQYNCLVSKELIPGTTMYVPGRQPTPPPTSHPVQTTIPCGPPFGWVYYTVQPGDTLYHIAQLFGITVSELMYANCLSDSYIRAGRSLFVPYVPTPNPTSTTRPSKTPKPPTPTRLPPCITSTPTRLPPCITPTHTSPPPITDTAAPTEIPTDTPVPTEIPTDTPVPTKIPTDTPVPTEIPTDTPVPTEIPTDTPVPTKIPTDTAVPTKIPTDTAVPTKIPTDTQIPPTTEVPASTSTPIATIAPTPGRTPLVRWRGYWLIGIYRGRSPDLGV